MANRTIQVDIPLELVESAVMSAFDSGIAYWARVKDYANLDDTPLLIAEVPFREGGWVQLEEVWSEDPTERCDRLSLATLQTGLRRMVLASPYQFGELVAGRGDAWTGDVLVQLAVFGEVKYG